MNIRDQALKALDTAKIDLARDKYLIPVAYIVTEDEITDFTLEFDNPEQKQAVYLELVNLANAKNAHAIITINDATVSDGVAVRSRNPIESDDSQVSARRDCIFVAVSGPAIRTWTICLPYEAVAGNIIYGDMNETFDDLLNLLPGWPKGQQTVT